MSNCVCFMLVICIMVMGMGLLMVMVGVFNRVVVFFRKVMVVFSLCVLVCSRVWYMNGGKWVWWCLFSRLLVKLL